MGDFFFLVILGYGGAPLSFLPRLKFPSGASDGSALSPRSTAFEVLFEGFFSGRGSSRLFSPVAAGRGRAGRGFLRF